MNKSGALSNAEYALQTRQIHEEIGLLKRAAEQGELLSPETGRDELEKLLYRSLSMQQIGPFITFFDWDQDAVTPEAQEILQNAADSCKSVRAKGAKIGMEVTGIASSTESAGRLPTNRLLSIVQWLRQNGCAVPATVSINPPQAGRMGFAAPDGVRDPSNRRVEIAFAPALY